MALMYYYAFAVADRNTFFLYGHLGFKPLDDITVGRYWMTGFVFSGFVSVPALIMFLAFRMISHRTGSLNIVLSPYRILFFSYVPLVPVLFLIIMFAGTRVLPSLIFLYVLISVFAGLFLVIITASHLVLSPDFFLYELIIASGLVPFILLSRAVELPSKGIMSSSDAWLIAALSLWFSFLWLWVFYFAFRKKKLNPFYITVISFFAAYVMLPVLHFMSRVPSGMPYITASSNFFADNMLLRTFVLILAVSIVFVFNKLSIKRISNG